MFDLHGRVAAVTGASSGLGRQMALDLLSKVRIWYNGKET